MADSESVSPSVGLGLIAVAFLTVVVAYPPPATGIAPLFGIGNMFLPLGLSALALLLAVGGGVLAGRGAANRTSRLSSSLVRLLVLLAAVVLVGGYLTTVAGFGF